MSENNKTTPSHTEPPAPAPTGPLFGNVPAGPEPPKTEGPAPQQPAPEPGPRPTPPTPPRAPAPRRVGTFTLGLVLILCGALLLAKIFVPGLNLLLLLRLSPVVLILLGLEMLLASAKPRDRLRYDWLSIFVSFVLVCASGAAVVAPYLLNHYGPYHSRAENRLGGELTDAAYAALADACPQVEDLSVHLSLNNHFTREEADALTLAALPSDAIGYAQGYFTLTGPYPSAETFAADCRAVLDAALTAGLPFTEWRFDNLHAGDQNGARYELYVEGPWQENADPDALARAVQAQYWYGDACYDSLEAWQAATAETAAAEETDDLSAAVNDAYVSGYADALQQVAGMPPEEVEELLQGLEPFAGLS